MSLNKTYYGSKDVEQKNFYFQALQDLNTFIERLQYKFENIGPHIKTREKRGLFNFIGTAHKWLYGNLDAEDGEYYDQTIEKLNRYQQNIQSELKSQITLTNKIIYRVSNSLGIIDNNQKIIKDHLNILEQEVEAAEHVFKQNYALGNVDRQISTNCIVLIEIMDQLENSIMFAKMQTAHPSIIHTTALQDMLNDLRTIYGGERIIKFFLRILVH